MMATKTHKFLNRLLKFRSVSISEFRNFKSANNIVKSTLPAISIPNLNAYEFLFENCNKWHDKVAVECAETGRSYTYAEYQKLSEKVAQALCAKLKLKKGDTLAILLPNIPEYLTVYLAALRCGIIVTTINPAYTPDEIARQLHESSAKIIVTLNHNYSAAQNAINKLQTNKIIPIITIKHMQNDSTPRGAINFQELCEYNGPEIKLESPSPNDFALLLYSSGTSGLPKGIQITHHNIVSELAQVTYQPFRLNSDTTSKNQDIMPVIAPMYHIYANVLNIGSAFSQGCKSVMLPKFSPKNFLDLFEKYPVNFVSLVPPIVLMLINNEKATKFHMRAIRNIVSAAAPIGSSDLERFLDKFGQNIKLLQQYGLTETTSATHAQRLDKKLVPGSVGCNLPLIESRIVSVEDESKNLGPNESGQLLIKGPNVMKGYNNNPKATEEVIDKEGWFKTGDIAHYNEDGEFFITDRIKELIKVNAYPVAPAELESLIRKHPKVVDVAVIGVKHPKYGEVPKAFVIASPKSGLLPEHVVQHVKEKAVKYKQLHGGVVFVESIPKTPSGKILRRLLKDY